MSQIPLLCVFLFAFLSQSICLSKLTPKNHGSKIRGMFVFGSSILDNGNNNFLPNSLAKVNYSPYGADFPLGPTGRFTNGKNVIDVLGEKLRLPNYIPPFNDPSTNGSKILHGVDFASGGSGILDVTGSIAGNVISLNQQIRNFESATLPDFELQLGEKSTKIMSDFLFVVGSGGNDYSLNYFRANNNITLQDFTTNLTTTLSLQLKRLYDLGARKFVLMAINPNGCSPIATASFPTRDCVRILNKAFHMFNSNLKNLVDAIRPQMPGSNLVFVNTYKVIRDIIKSPSTKGFSDVKSPCCEVGPTGVLCKRGGLICKNRSEYVFFDGLHPTEAVNYVIANKAFKSNLKSEVYPFNVKRLSQIYV
ncbi:hypothetical protein ABFX02_03G108500 [Erythranthe guttata]